MNPKESRAPAGPRGRSLSACAQKAGHEGRTATRNKGLGLKQHPDSHADSPTRRQPLNAAAAP